LGDVDFDNLVFGKIFSDHMFIADYHDGAWQDARVVPYQNLQMPPANMTLHYAQSIFEGMKAYYQKSGKVCIFRPDDHAQRINESADRMCIPRIDPDLFKKGLFALIDIDREWVPKKEGDSLYIRPFVFATDEHLGLRPSHTYSFMIITTPVSAYYGKGLPAISLMSSGEYVRAGEGGTGEAKAAGNYAASLYPLELAQKEGYDQTLWLDGKEHRYVEECGTMNIFFRFDDELVTPDLDGSILRGLTRDCVMTLAKEWATPCQNARSPSRRSWKARRTGRLRRRSVRAPRPSYPPSGKSATMLRWSPWATALQASFHSASLPN
jgi:branched-chain amino acid aminotransferase